MSGVRRLGGDIPRPTSEAFSIHPYTYLHAVTGAPRHQKASEKAFRGLVYVLFLGIPH